MSIDTRVDTRAEVETPEGVQLALNPAGPLVRVLAYLVDFLIRSTALFAVGMVLYSLDGFGRGIMAILVFLAEWFYPVLFELFAAGATPGKRLFGLRVVHDDGTPVNAQSSMLRNLLRVADFLPLGYAAGLISMAVSQRFQRLGDLAAGTLVVYQSRLSKPIARTEAGQRNVFPGLQPRERQVLLGFAERREQLSTGRRLELAAILGPALDAKDEDAVREIERMVNTMTGER